MCFVLKGSRLLIIHRILLSILKESIVSGFRTFRGNVKWTEFTPSFTQIEFSHISHTHPWPAVFALLTSFGLFLFNVDLKIRTEKIQSDSLFASFRLQAYSSIIICFHRFFGARKGKGIRDAFLPQKDRLRRRKKHPACRILSDTTSRAGESSDDK